MVGMSKTEVIAGNVVHQLSLHWPVTRRQMIQMIAVKLNALVWQLALRHVQQIPPWCHGWELGATLTEGLCDFSVYSDEFPVMPCNKPGLALTFILPFFIQCPKPWMSSSVSTKGTKRGDFSEGHQIGRENKNSLLFRSSLSPTTTHK